MTDRIAIIPARGGSKRIPRKNIRPFCGIPALGRVIRTLQEAAIVDRIVVSTDDDEIAAIGTQYGAEMLPRPEDLSDDYTTLTPVVQHAANTLGLAPDAMLLCMLPTAVMISAASLRKGYDIYSNAGGPGFVVPVLEFNFPPQRGVKMAPDHRLTAWMPENILARSQDLPKIWHDSGQFYIAPVARWHEAKNPFLSESYGFPVDFLEAQDIDTEDDWRRAEMLFSLRSHSADG